MEISCIYNFLLLLNFTDNSVFRKGVSRLGRDLRMFNAIENND